MNDAAWHDAMQVDHTYGAGQIFRDGVSQVTERLCRQWRYMAESGMTLEEIANEDGFNESVVQVHTSGRCSHG